MDKLCRKLNAGLEVLTEEQKSDKGINYCDRCGEMDYVSNLIWESDDIWWDSRRLSNPEQNLYMVLCEECFEELK